MGSGRSLASQRICARAVGIGGAGDSARLSYAYYAQAHARLSVACSRALAAGRVGVIAGSTLERSVRPQGRRRRVARPLAVSLGLRWVWGW